MPHVGLSHDSYFIPPDDISLPSRVLCVAKYAAFHHTVAQQGRKGTGVWSVPLGQNVVAGSNSEVRWLVFRLPLVGLPPPFIKSHRLLLVWPEPFRSQTANLITQLTWRTSAISWAITIHLSQGSLIWKDGPTQRPDNGHYFIARKKASSPKAAVPSTRGVDLRFKTSSMQEMKWPRRLPIMCSNRSCL